jgi:hypothetical protein
VACNVSFGVLAFSPVGAFLMLLVVAVEMVLLSRLTRTVSRKPNYFLLSLTANAASGLVGLMVSVGITGGWWLVVWVPWVTAAEASREQWPALAGFMAVAYIGSVAIESAVTMAFLRGVSPFRVVAMQAVVNLVSSAILLGIFWAIGGVPGR